MTHIALTGTVGGKNVDWLEKVSDERRQPVLEVLGVSGLPGNTGPLTPPTRPKLTPWAASNGAMTLGLLARGLKDRR